MGAHRVVFLDRLSLKANVRKPAKAESYVEHDKTSVDEIVGKLAGATVAITNKVPLRAETLSKLPDLKMIAVAATGYDVIDVPYCKANGIAVANIRNYAVHTVPEHAFALILALRRSILAYRQDVEAGVWQKSDQFCFFTHPIGDLHGSTLGIIGEGAIGQGTAAIARGFGMKVLFADHEPPKMPGVEFTPARRGDRAVGRDLAALPVDAGHPQRDRPGADAPHEAHRPADQHLARWTGRRGSADPGAR